MTGLLLQDKVGVITGASSGIGRSAAQVFADHGARLVLADVDEAGGADTAHRIVEAGGSAVFVRADVSEPAQVEAMVAAAVERYGRLDCAFNNAGVDGRAASIGEDTEQNFDHVTAVNLKGVWLCVRAEIPHLLAAGGGAIVNTASAAGLVGVGLGMAPYVAAKHGVVGLTKAAALEYATAGIRVNAVCPGGVRTAMLDDAIGQRILTEQQAAALQPVNRLGTPEEVAQAAAWLCSDRASFITGHALSVDGGFVAR